MKTSTGILCHDNVPASNVLLSNGKSNCVRVNSSYLNGPSGTGKGVNGMKTTRTITWNKELPEKLSFTMRREIDKAREETDLINQLRNVSCSLIF